MKDLKDEVKKMNKDEVILEEKAKKSDLKFMPRNPFYTVIAISVVALLCLLSYAVGTHHPSNFGGMYRTTIMGSSGRAGLGVMPGSRGGIRKAGSVGAVSAVSASSITIFYTQTDSSRTLTIDSSTAITNNGVKIAVSDIRVGDIVTVTPNTSDTTKAATISINPSRGVYGGAQSAIDQPL